MACFDPQVRREHVCATARPHVDVPDEGEVDFVAQGALFVDEGYRRGRAGVGAADDVREETGVGAPDEEVEEDEEKNGAENESETERGEQQRAAADESWGILERGIGHRF